MSVEIRKPLYKKGDLVFFDFDNGEHLDLYQSRESDFEVKLLVNPKLSEEKRQFIDDVISNYMHKYDICIHSDGITYSKNKPHRKWADLPAGLKFYHSLYKYNEYFVFLEYYSYLEGDFNGTVYRYNQ